MGFIKRLLDRFRRDYDEYEEEWDEEETPREIDFNNREQRADYVKNCLEKMAEATKELENLNFEYNMVTSYLKDMEEIEALPPEEGEQLKDCARRVSLLQDRKTDFMGRPRRITDEKYRLIERMEDGISAYGRRRGSDAHFDLCQAYGCQAGTQARGDGDQSDHPAAEQGEDPLCE